MNINQELKIGDKGTVLSIQTGHEFEIGEPVTIMAIEDEGESIKCKNKYGVEWYLAPYELSTSPPKMIPVEELNEFIFNVCITDENPARIIVDHENYKQFINKYK